MKNTKEEFGCICPTSDHRLCVPICICSMRSKDASRLRKRAMWRIMRLTRENSSVVLLGGNSPE